MDFLSFIADFLTSFFIILLLLVFFYGQNWQGWHASKQIKKSMQNLEVWRDYGLELIKKTIEPISSESITSHEVDLFIKEMLDFFVLTPSDLEPDIFFKLHYLMSKREERYHQLIQKFLPTIDELNLTKITSLLNTTSEINSLLKNVRHNLIVGEQTKSYLFLLQNASEITQTMLTAKAYVRALDSFMDVITIGDSIGPLTVRSFVETTCKAHNISIPLPLKLCQDYYYQKFVYSNRICYCLRAKGPESRVGRPGDALDLVISEINAQKLSTTLILTIDAYMRLEGEKSGTVAQGLGAAVGSGKANNIDKFQIETIALKQNPAVPIEAIVCRQSLLEAVEPMTEEISLAIPKIHRIIKQTIRTQTKEGDVVIILGIGNAIGVPL